MQTSANCETPGVVDKPATKPTYDRLTMSRYQCAALFSAPFVIVAIAWGGGAIGYSLVRDDSRSIAHANAPTKADGVQLYNQHCANCHGVNGDGAGIAGPYLSPSARWFGEERFRLATTANGVPTDEDLIYVVKHGIPGSAMPKFDELPDEEVRSVIAYVRHMTRGGLFRRIVRKLKEDGEVDYAQACELCDNLVRPGAALDVPKEFPSPTAESIARGEKTYVTACLQCHGPKGRGDGPQVKDLKNENGRPTHPRDLSKGVFKGGGDPERLYKRIVVGMPGTPMPATTNLKPDEVCDLIAFVLSLTKGDEK